VIIISELCAIIFLVLPVLEIESRFVRAYNTAGMRLPCARFRFKKCNKDSSGLYARVDLEVPLLREEHRVRVHEAGY
jgi:hypothetical protein